ncbi:GNAT family N-acetyltransferase [Streptomyces sp. NBC_00536]|uniref:GNAT family N-acetyltransferase n=1 Tax=Streptomyces sp. NBC_00536 TaxID=2975769 RepID=UPI002E818751|nr:GNAT family N-acetyltransferase [Streptomyces sp. NBC_00536]WUC80720.1 GNAT family N-acetyltransferase [Streptomyces sp. NBC_00536]
MRAAESGIQQISAFMSGFARRQAERTVDLPGGFAALDDTFHHSHADNQVVIDDPAALDPDTLAGIADEALGHLPFRMVSVFDDEGGAACVEPMVRAGYSHMTLVVLRHTGPVPTAPLVPPAAEVDLAAFREPLARRWRGFLPDAEDEVVDQLVDRRRARFRGADTVRFLGSRTPGGDVAAWADLYLDPASGTAQIEDLMADAAQLGRGHGDAVLAAALRTAAAAGCGTRFLTADGADWPRHWYARRGFVPVGRGHVFERA